MEAARRVPHYVREQYGSTKLEFFSLDYPFHNNDNGTMRPKLRVGWFSLTCCEDSTIIFTELLNTHYREWRSRIDFVHARVLKQESEAALKTMDVAFVEGAISSDSQEEKLRKIRAKAKVLVAIGSCAVSGSPANQRNSFNPRQRAEVQPILERFGYKDQVLKLSDLVTVDAVVPGCPMDEAKFLELLGKFLKAN